MTTVRAERRTVDTTALWQAIGHGVILTGACLLTYWLTTDVLSRLHSLSRSDDLLGGMWAVIAAVFVYRPGWQPSVDAAVSRAAATSVSFALCFVYLLLFPFRAWGLAVLIGIGSALLGAAGRSQDVVTSGVTTAVVLIVAALAPHDPWLQPILRMADTAIGIAVALAASWLAVHVTRRISGSLHV